MNRPTQIRRNTLAPTILAVVVVSWMSGASSATPTGPGGYKLDPGPWKAASQDLVLRDEKRGDRGARAYLGSDALEASSGKNATLQRK